MKRFIGAAACAALFTIFGAVAPAALAAKNACPSGGTPPTGSEVHGGLEVDGVCILNGVTVDGGTTVDSTGALQLSAQSTANGGITVNPGGELDVNATTPQSGTPTNTTSTIHGGVVLNNPIDVDIWTAQIDGGLSMTGAFPLHPNNTFDQPTICGNAINGDVTLSNITTFGSYVFGDPTDPTAIGPPCPGNDVHGSLLISNAKTGEVEGNTFSGSATLDGSTLQFNGNTIGGSLSCTNGNVILPPEAGDPTGNTVGGSNSC
jgi:hypothetical protein